MGTAFLYGNGGSGGTGATLTVTAPAGCTVTISRDGKTKTKTAGADGLAVFQGLATGEWTLTITDGGQTASKVVTVTADYAVSITFFAATINVTYPAGSICTATDGVTTLAAPDTSGTWACVVPNAGTWIFELENGLRESVVVQDSGETHTIDKWYLFNKGVICNTNVTGGLSSAGYGFIVSSSYSIADATIGSDSMKFRVNGVHDSCISGTQNTLDLSRFSHLYARVSQIDSTGFTVGVHNEKKVWDSKMDAYATTTSTGLVNVDLSGISGMNYVACVLFGTSVQAVQSAEVTEIWLE